MLGAMRPLMRSLPEKKPFTEKIHGWTLSDPYRWLEKPSDERTAWIERSNEQTDEELHTSIFETYQKRLLEVYSVDTRGGYSAYGKRVFFYRRSKGQAQATLWCQEWPNGKPECILDPNELDPTGQTAIAGVSVSEDGSHMAYGLSTDGSDWARWRLRDLETGTDLPDEWPRLAYTQFTWEKDCKGVYYTRSPGTDADALTKTDCKAFHHTLGTDWKEDKMVFGDTLEADELCAVADVGDDGRAVIIVFHDMTKTSLYRYDPKDGKAVALTTAHAMYEPIIEKGVLYVQTDLDAPNGRICKGTLDTSIDEWETIIAEDAPIEDFSVHGTNVFVTREKDAQVTLSHYDAEGTLRTEVSPEGIGSLSTVMGSIEHDALFYTRTSFTEPLQVYRYHCDSHDSDLVYHNAEVSTERFVTERHSCTSKDGTRVPYFLIRAEKTVLPAPTILYAYGGFGVSLTPQYDPGMLPWLERGGVYVVANLRGGGEFGRDWHENGRREHKQNSFDDCIAVGEELRKKTASRLGVWGGSNGGLLAGAMLVQRPDLWDAVCSDVPLLDMLRFNLTEGGAFWTGEYGDPDDEKEFDWLYAYSPYHHVQKIAYPASLFVTSLGDDRGVDPFHAMKMTALVRERTTGKAPILLRVETGTGHGHGKSVERTATDAAEHYAFFERFLN